MLTIPAAESTSNSARRRATTAALPDAAEDRRLVEAFQAGDMSAFDTIALRYRRILVRLAATRTRDEDEALDVVQEAMLRAYRALPRFRRDCTLSTWLYRIVVNTATTHRERRARHIDRARLEWARAPEGSLARRNPPRPDEIVEGEQFEAELNAAMADLSDKLRNAVVLREYHGLSYECIAELTDVPVGTVRSRIFRAREYLSERLDVSIR